MAGNGKTLHEALAEIGLTARPSPTLYKRSLYRGPEFLGDFDAHEAWAAINDGALSAKRGAA